MTLLDQPQIVFEARTKSTSDESRLLQVESLTYYQNQYIKL